MTLCTLQDDRPKSMQFLISIHIKHIPITEYSVLKNFSHYMRTSSNMCMVGDVVMVVVVVVLAVICHTSKNNLMASSLA